MVFLSNSSKSGFLVWPDFTTAQIERLLSSEAKRANLRIRRVVDHMCVLNNYLSFLFELNREPGRNTGSQKSLLVDLYYCLFVDQTVPMENPELPVLIQGICKESSL